MDLKELLNQTTIQSNHQTIVVSECEPINEPINLSLIHISEPTRQY